MGSLTTGGGSSAVAASTHAACERFRRTDPLITGKSRRLLARQIGYPDTTAGIPEARWMRAMTFERLVRSDDFVSPLLTTTVGALGLPRPDSVRRADGRVNIDVTAKVLAQAHLKAVHEDVSTMITGLAVPYVGFEEDTGTPVKPDFAIVVPRRTEGATRPLGSWLIVWDAKDYERVRSRIDDGRMLKGFLQVALGAESFAHWSKLPNGMQVHRSGALAVPRNAFLQPMAVVEQLDDHRLEVMTRAAERKRQLEGGQPTSFDADHLTHITATYDPATCRTCALYTFCRSELRNSSEPLHLLTEIGVRPAARAGLLTFFADGAVDPRVPESLVHQLRATVEGMAVRTGQRRVDPAGLPGTINVVLAKSDSAALGVHGLAVRQHTSQVWGTHFFEDSHYEATRREVMRILGEALNEAMGVQEKANPGAPSPVHLVVPDAPTADVLVSIADSLAGVELSRLRWERDLEVGRTPLTFNGEQASVPKALTDPERLAVSFLLEEDRARTMQLRCPIVNLRDVLARHLIPGGPRVDAGRLDYLVRWAQADGEDHRQISDAISDSPHTPGARLANETSDAIHVGLRRRARGRAPEGPDPEKMVLDELAYKAAVLDEALAILDEIEPSTLREAFRAIEGDAQEVWRRRLHLHANDLVRFGRVYRTWRDRQVDLLQKDRECGDKLWALSNPELARDHAVDPGHRFLSRAEVVSLDPLTLKVDGRAVQDGARVVLVVRNGEPQVDGGAVAMKIQKGSFKLSGVSAGPVIATGAAGEFVWEPKIEPVGLEVGDELILADGDWLNVGKYNKDAGVARPGVDTQWSPKAECLEENYYDDPEAHQWCCKPHEVGEAEWSDTLAERRANGELNPQVWPPVIDIDGFDVIGDEEITAEDADDLAEADGRESLTMDDLD